MKKVWMVGVIVGVATLIVSLNAYAGKGRGAMDGSGPLAITSGCQGNPPSGWQPGTGQQVRRGQCQGGICAQVQGSGSTQR